MGLFYITCLQINTKFGTTAIYSTYAETPLSLPLPCFTVKKQQQQQQPSPTVTSQHFLEAHIGI